VPPSKDNPESLGREMARGGFILVLGRLSVRLLSLISIMILFRFLVPEDFGLVSLAAVVVGLVETLSEFGFDRVLIQQRNAQRADYDTTWTLGLIRGLLCGAVLVAIAYPAAEFLKDPRLTPMILWLAITPVLDGLQNVGTVDFTKEFQFGKDYVLKVSQKIVSFVVTLVLAYVLRNYWALVIGIIAGKAAGLALSYILHPFRPRLHITGWRRIFRFSFWLMLNNVIIYAGSQTDKVLIERRYDSHVVGIFRVAEEIASIVMEVVWPIERALYAGYSKLSHNLAELRRSLLTSIGFVSMISVPMSVGILLVADPLVVVLLGEKGREAIPFVQVLALHGALRSCICGALPIFIALGMPRVNVQVTLAMVIVRLAVLFAAFPVMGAMAAPWAVVAGSATSVFLVWILVTRHMHLHWRELPATIWGVVMATLLMALALELATPAWNWLGISGTNWSLLSAKVALGVVVYTLAIGAIWYVKGRPDGPERYLLNMVSTRLRQQFGG
jgi:O-antigen/teichoic acid export membrane protein